jgi:hypothetical protein
MAELDNATAVLRDTFITEAQNAGMEVVAILPGLLIAIIVFILGWVVAVLISRLFAGFLRVVKLEDFLKEHKVEDSLGTIKISNVLVKILKYFIILMVLQKAISLVELGTISVFLYSMLVYAPVFIGALLIALLAFILGEYVKEVIIELQAKSPMVRFMARGTKLVIIFIGVTMALATAGFDTSLISNIFIVVLQALVFGIALGVGIAFGLGGQKDAKDLIGTWRKHLKV